jgi:hypothetical protein
VGLFLAVPLAFSAFLETTLNKSNLGPPLSGVKMQNQNDPLVLVLTKNCFAFLIVKTKQNVGSSTLQL